MSKLFHFIAEGKSGRTLRVSWCPGIRICCVAMRNGFDGFGPSRLKDIRDAVGYVIRQMRLIRISTVDKENKNLIQVAEGSYVSVTVSRHSHVANLSLYDQEDEPKTCVYLTINSLITFRREIMDCLLDFHKREKAKRVIRDLIDPNDPEEEPNPWGLWDGGCGGDF